MAQRKSGATRKTKSSSKTDSKCEINLVGGKMDGQTMCIVFPSPKFLVLSMGRELYRREDPDGILEATYRYTDDWDAYDRHRKERALYIK